MAVDLDFERQLHAAMHAPAGSLFETFADKALRRVDEVLVEKDCKFPVDDSCKLMLTLLRNHRGRGRAVPLIELATRMHASPRTIKDLIRELRQNFGVLICSSRDGDGYWIAVAPDEVFESMQPYLAQAISELRLYHTMMRDTESLEQTLSQIRLKLTYGDGDRAKEVR